MRRSRAEVRLYFAAQVVYTLALFWGARRYGIHSDVYRYIFVGATLPILEVCLLIIGRTRQGFMRLAIIFGMVLGCLAALDAVTPAPGELVTLIEGIVLSALGLGLIFVATDTRDRRAVTLIGVFCIVMSCFDFGFVRESWETLNKWLPSFVGAACFGAVALLPRVPERTLALG